MAAIRSFIKIQPITGKSGIAQNMDQVRKGINRMGSVTDGIAKSFYDTTELLKFEKEYLTDTSKTEVTTIKRKDKKDKTKWTTSMRDFRRTFRKKKRGKLEDEAEKGVEEGKEEGRKAVEKQKPKLNMLGGLFNGLFKVFKYMIIFGALNWLSNPKNAESAVKVFKILFTIGKFAFKVTKFGVGLLLDGLTNVIGNFKEEGPIRRAFRGILGVVQLMGGLAALRTAQYLIMPWKLMKDVNRLRMIFNMSNQQSAEQDANQKVRKSGFRDKKTGVIYSKEEYEAMKKSAAKAERKNPGAGKAFEDRFGKESRFSKFKGKASAARKRFGAGANKAFGKLGGKLNVGMSVVGGAGRIAAGLASGEKASSAVGAGVGQGVGGLVGGIAGTALLGPFLGPFAPIVGNAIGSFLGEWVGKELGPIMEPIFGPIGKAFKMMFEVVKMTIGPLFQQLAEPLGLIFGFIGQLGKVLMDAAKILGDFAGFIFGGMMDAIGGTVQFVVNNAKRLMNPASVAGGIADALTFNLFDFDKENKKAAGGPVQMAAGGALQFGSHPDMLGMVGGLYLKTIVGSFGAFGFVGNKVKSVLAPDIQKIAGGLGVQVSTGGGGTAGGGVSNSVQFQATQTEKKKAEAVKTFAYKENIYNAIDKGLNKLLISGIKIFDPALAKQIEEKKSGGGGGQTPRSTSSSGGGGSPVGEIEGGWAPVLNLILKYEAGSGGYDSMYPGTTLPGASGMPIADVASKATGAVGAWQNLPEYLNQRAVAVGLDPKKDIYNEENQQLIAEYLIGPGQAQVSKQMAKENPKEAMLRLSRVWAAIPKDDGGASFYAGDGVNVAHIKPQMMYDAFEQLAKGGRVKRGARVGMGEPILSAYEDVAEKVQKKKEIMGYAAGGLLATNGSVPDVRLTPQTPFSDYPLHHNKSDNDSYNNNRLGGHPIVPRDYVIVRDFSNPSLDRGSPVVAGVDGKVTTAGGSYNTVIINKNGKDRMQFHHFDSLKVAVGQTVNPNTILGLQGNKPSGLVHVHLDATPSDHRAYAAHQLGGEFDDSMAETNTTGGGGDANAGGGGDKKGVSDSKPAKPKTLEEMLEAFKTGLTSALTKISTNVPKSNPTKSAEELPGNPVATNPTVSAPSEIKQLGSVRDKAVKDLKSIGDKAQRDEDANFLPVITERLVIQKVRQTINTKGSTSAVYTKPSPLLTK